MNFWGGAGSCHGRFDCISCAQWEIVRNCTTMIPGLCSGLLLSPSAMSLLSSIVPRDEGEHRGEPIVLGQNSR